MRWCEICGGFHPSDPFEYLTWIRERYGVLSPLQTEEPESSRIRGLRAMANQNESPNERDIAIQKLKEMGLQP